MGERLGVLDCRIQIEAAVCVDGKFLTILQHGKHGINPTQIFIEPQGFCVMAGIGVKDGRAQKALDSVKERLDTKYGIVRTDHILFIAAGAFHVSKPSDLIPDGSAESVAVELAGVAVALSNLSAVLLLYIQAETKRSGTPVDGLALLEIVRTHHQARADLASLDDGAPFDE